MAAEFKLDTKVRPVKECPLRALLWGWGADSPGGWAEPALLAGRTWVADELSDTDVRLLAPVFFRMFIVF